ncbi:MAG TPA: hypothetical protein VMT64_09855 [Candidatus Binataceae bacterium]|nr:hypothetical protein [Candidatus Binataceae bacterium]
MRDETTAAAIRASAANRHLDDAHTEKWLAMLTPSRMALLDYAERLNLRTGQLVAAIDLLDEIEIREGIAPADILARDELRRICTQGGSGPWRAAAFIEALRKIRFPRLREAMDRLSAEVASLRLPSGVRVMLPKDLGSDELTVQISARTPEEMEKLIDAVAEKKPALARLAKLLGGDDSEND